MKSYLTDLEANPIFNELFKMRQLELIDTLVKKWQQPWRFYHSYWNHLIPILDTIKRLSVPENDKHLLEIAAWFHDCVYDPKQTKPHQNEKSSMHFFHNSTNNHTPNVRTISELIDMTKDFDFEPNVLKMHFAKLDLACLRYPSLEQIVKNELLMMKEFQFVDYSEYKRLRLEALEKLGQNRHTNGVTVGQIRRYLQSHRPRIGIYPGSFNPFHVGHLSILKEAEKIFDKIIIAIGVNPEKDRSGTVEQIKSILPYHQVEHFDTFLHKYAEERAEDADITIVRGFRSGYDIEEELKNLAFMRDMSENFKLMFIAPQKKYDHISSSAIRLIKNFGKKESEVYIPQVYYPLR